MFLKAASKCFRKYEKREAKLERKHIKIIKEIKKKLEEDKKSRIDIIKNESFKLLSNSYTKKKKI